MKMLHILITGLFFSIYLIPMYLFADQKIDQKSIQNDFVKNECLIKFKPGTNKTHIDLISNYSKFTILAYYPHGQFYRVRIPAKQDVSSYVKTLVQHSAIEQAQPDYYISTISYSTGSSIPLQWNSGNISSNNIALSNLIDTGLISSENSIVGIIDGGVAFENYQNHKKASSLSNTRFCAGFNFVSFDEHPNDNIGNGTIVTTIISNLYKNISNNTSITNLMSIMPVKITDQSGIGRTSALIEGILFAVNNGASILNISAAGPDSPLLRDAISQAFNRGATIICAAGTTADAKSRNYPAAYNEYCIAVTANGCTDLQPQSVTDQDYIDLSAPGEIYFHNVKPSCQSTACGTSVAAAQVTATAVLLKASGIDGSDKIRQALEQSCFDKPPRGWDQQTGWGILDVHKALKFFPAPDHDIQVTNFKVSPWCIKGELLQTITTVKNQGNFEHDISITLSDIQTSKILATTKGSIKPHQSNQYILIWNTGYEEAGSHELCISANISGDEDPADNTQYKEVVVAEDKRDVEISGIELKKQTEENCFLANIQIKNRGTFNEIIHLRVQDSSGTFIGQKDTQICAQCIMFVPVLCQTEIEDTLKALNISIETADLQETDMTNNCVVYPFNLSE